MASSGGASSSTRGKSWFTNFSTQIPAKSFSAANLEAFAATAGALAGLEQDIEQAKAAFFAARGAPLNDESVNAKTIRRNEGRSGLYRDTLQNVRHSYVLNLYNQGRLRSLEGMTQSQAAAAGVSGAGEVSKKDVEDILARAGIVGANVGDAQQRAAILQYLRAQTPLGFKTNALEELARRLKIVGFTTITDAAGNTLQGDAKKEALYDLILGQLSGQAAPARRGAAAANLLAVGPVAGVGDILRQFNVNDAAGLSGLTVERLRQIAKAASLVSSGTKSVLINRIANAGGYNALPSAAEANQRVLDIIALSGPAFDQALAQARAIDPAVLNQVSVANIRELARALQLRAQAAPGQRTTGQLSRQAIIELLTGARAPQAASQELRRNIRASREACSNASLLDVQDAARAAGIYFTNNTSKEELCDALFGQALQRASQLLLGRGGELTNIYNTANANERAALISRLAQDAGLTGVTDFNSLLNRWLASHYQGLALAQGANQADVTAFLASGALPASDIALYNLGRVFSDLDPNLASSRAAAADREARLRLLYNSFINQFSAGEAAALGAFQRGLPQYSFRGARSPGAAYAPLANNRPATTASANRARSPLSPRLTSSVAAAAYGGGAALPGEAAAQARLAAASGAPPAFI